MSAATLRRAAEIVRERGLAYREFVDSTGACCTLGALRLSHFGSPLLPFGASAREYVDDQREVADVLGFAGSPSRLTVWLMEWNDAPERTADEVIAALEAAAARLEATS